MSIISDKTKFLFKKIAVLTIIFLFLFFGSFYIVNFLDLRPAPKATLAVNQSIGIAVNDPELIKRAGKDNINLADFQSWAKANNLTGNNIYDGDPDKDGLLNYQEYLYGTDPNNADTNGNGYPDRQEIANGYDPVFKGDARTVVSVKIDKIGVDAPMVWSKTDVEANMLADLENGLSHFEKTAAPGQNGNMIISGHSSNYIWAKGNYNHVFKDLSNLNVGDIINVQTIQKNGRIINYKYKVNDTYITTPDDAKIFVDTKTPTLTLSTCWPVGTNLKRTIVKAELVI